MTTGLYLGKFAPFHAGHQHVVETALARVDDLLVMIYDEPEVTNVPLTVRADWIRECYPEVAVVEAWTGPTEVGYTAEEKRRHEAYILDRLGDREVTHFFSSEPYGAHVSAALGAENVQVDPDRETVPISGTEVRAAPYEHREFVHPRVYRDLVANVVLLGGPSTGKTTLARRLADEHDTEWMPEYGREYWEEHNVDRRLTADQLVEIAAGHREREDERLEAAREYLFTDTNAITTYVFCRYYHGEAPTALYEYARDCAARYDLTFLCGTDVPYDDTPDRSGPANRERLQKMTRAFLERHNVPYDTLTGDVEERVAAVARVLASFEQYETEQPVP